MIPTGNVSKRTWVYAGKKHAAYRYTLTTTAATGKRKRHRKQYPTRAEAQAALDALREELKRPVVKAAASITVAQAFEKYYAAKSRKRSLAEDRRLGEHLMAVFGGDTPLSAVTASRIAEYKAARLATTSRQTGGVLSAASINRPLALLRHVLRLAHEEWEALDIVPRVRLEREAQGRLRWLTPEEAARLLAACTESKNDDLADLVEFALFTGVRQSEALRLTWDRVDRARGVILLESTKSNNRREVPLNDAADGVLARRGGRVDGLVFRSANWDRYRTAWESAVKRAKLSDVRFHDLRHTFASWAVQKRVTLYELKDVLGHSSLTMVQRYAHLAPEHRRAAAAALDGILQGTKRAHENALDLINARN
jgi:integrase